MQHPIQRRPVLCRPMLRRTVTGGVVALLMFLSFIAGSITGYSAQPALAQRSTPTEFEIFWEAWDLTVEYFVDRDRIDFTAMTYGAIKGMLETLGDENHTAFASPEEAEQQAAALEGSFEGIGAYVRQEEGVFIIVAPMLGSPAEAAGILAGDTVQAIDGLEITGMAEWEAISLIRGPSGTTVVLTVIHADSTEPVDISIVRGRINIDSVLWARIPGTDLVHLQLIQFSADSSRELRAALQEILAEAENGQPVAGIMFDLRNNPGGFVQEALRIASHFLPEGEIILHERDARDRITTYRSQGEGLAREIPLVVLINQGSASASEIVSGAIQESGRARLVGMPTVGTGTVLRPFTLSDGSILRLGVTNWLTPDYDLIKGVGVQPNMRIDQPVSTSLVNAFTLAELDERSVRLVEDRQFQAALLWLSVQSRNTAGVTATQPSAGE